MTRQTDIFGDRRAVLYKGDCLAILPTLAAGSMDAIVTDPPYHLTTGKKGGAGPASENLASPAGRSRATTGFMGKAWDGGDIAHDPAVWREALRVAKPGAHLLAFGGTRTFHRLACAIEDAGWEIRDTVMWVYGSGFPKSLDVSKAIDKAAGAERNYALHTREDTGFRFQSRGTPSTPPITDAARRWDGWGTALKPAWEPIIVARKPLEGTVAENVQRHGTGAMNIDGCRVGTSKRIPGSESSTGPTGFQAGWGTPPPGRSGQNPNIGRWPANLIHDGSEEVVAEFDKAGVRTRGGWPQRGGRGGIGTSGHKGYERPDREDGDSGSAARFFQCCPPDPRGDWTTEFPEWAARFFYTAKAGGRERWFYCRDCQNAFPMAVHDDHGHGHVDAAGKQTWNHIVGHPTQKPESLMRYLCRLVTPPGGVVLDPFLGSGSTGKAAVLEGFRFIGIELDAHYLAIAAKRIRAGLKIKESAVSHRSPPLARRMKDGGLRGAEAGACGPPAAACAQELPAARGLFCGSTTGL